MPAILDAPSALPPRPLVPFFSSGWVAPGALCARWVPPWSRDAGTMGAKQQQQREVLDTFKLKYHHYSTQMFDFVILLD